MTEAQTMLEPCPFCGGIASYREHIYPLICCGNSNCIGPLTTAEKFDDAVAQWNTRATAAAQPVALNRLDIAKIICCGEKCILDGVADCVALKYGDGKKADLILAASPLPTPAGDTGADGLKALALDMGRLIRTLDETGEHSEFWTHDGDYIIDGRFPK